MGADDTNVPVLPAGVDDDAAGRLSISVTTAFCCDPRSLVFAAELHDVPAWQRVSFAWDFGDGRTASGPNPRHTYGWPGEYVVRLTATLPDDSILTVDKTITLLAVEVPTSDDGEAEPPDEPEEESEPEVVAVAGPDQHVAAGDLVTLDARNSYGTGDDALVFEWRQVKGPTAALSDPAAITATFTAPADLPVETILHFALIVSQGNLVDVDDVVVTVAPARPPIRFAVLPHHGSLVEVLEADEPQSTEEIQRFTGSWGSATIRAVSPMEYELTLHAAVDTSRVFFPWFAHDYPCDRILYPHMMGLVIDNHRLTRGRWSDESIAIYPGQTVFPGAVMETDQEARGVFAVNWPPVDVYAIYAKGRVVMRYDQWLAAGQTRRYRAMIVDATGDAGALAWHKALDPYKQWLTANMQSDGLLPVQHPTWLLDAHGWSNVQLQDYDDPMGEVRYRWDEWSDLFPLVQTWGHMSGRHYPPDESTGCCLIDTNLHPRNAELPAISAQIVAEGGRIGHYVRPRNAGPVAGTHPAADGNRQFMLDWIEKNRVEFAGNMNYLDWFIARPLGPVLDVAHQFRDGLWGEGTVCERAVDVYPTAFMMSGALWGGARFQTTAALTLEDAPPGQMGISFPRLVRYVLDDRVIFLGESNGDHVLWGTSRGGYFWGERMAFLLGCKLDWMQREDSGAGANPAVPAIVQAWTESQFWQRQPVYLDTLGLNNVPPAFDIRRFRGSSGETILAIDNSVGLPVVRFQLDSHPVTVDLTSWFKIVILND